MAFPEQEVPLILIIFLGSFGSAFILFYRHFLCPKESSGTMQKVYVFGSLAASFLGVASVLCANRTLFLFNWILSGLLICYSVVSLFLPSNCKTRMITWSDFFLVGLTVAFFILRYYASLLLTYDRIRQKKGNPSLLRPIPKPFDLYTVDYPNHTMVSPGDIPLAGTN